MNNKFEEDLKSWLLQVTHGLTPEVEANLHEEISSHYNDAVTTHKQTGMSDEEAHQKAMKELGDANEVAKKLRATHLTKDQCRTASIISLVYPLLMPLALWFLNQHISESVALIVTELAILFPTLYVLSAFTKLNQYRFRLLDMPLTILIWSVIVGQSARILHFAIFQQTVFERGDGLQLFSYGLLSSILVIIAIIAEFSGGISMILFGSRLAKLTSRLFGLRKPLEIVFCGMGTASLGVGVGVLLDVYLLAGIASVIGYVTLIITFALLSLVFYRSAYRRPSNLAIEHA